MANKPMKAAIAKVENATVRNLLSGRNEIQTLRWALYCATVEHDPTRQQVLAVADAILPGNWREIAAMPRLEV